jgi:hypothetical protein
MIERRGREREGEGACETWRVVMERPRTRQCEKTRKKHNKDQKMYRYKKKC